MQNQSRPIEIDARDLLVNGVNEILSKWPDFSRLHAFKQQMQELNPLLAVDFKDGDLTTIAGSVRQVIQIDKIDRDATIDFLGEDEYPYRAILTLESDAVWRLRSLRPQCAACFGSGIIDDKTCIICEGAGWH